MKTNICTLSDSYKFCHFNQYPDGTEGVYSYFESRKGATFNKTVFFGLQYIIKSYLEGVVVTREKIDRADKLISSHLGPRKFNRAGWEYILNAHGGRLPVVIRAVPEGTPVTINNVLMTVENTDPKCFWLTNYLETILTHVWYGSTVASLSRETKLMFNTYADWTCDDKDILPFQLHDFGFRGVSSVESAGIGGLAHLINFMGTDTVQALEAAMEYYHADSAVGFSVPATEHSIMTSLGQAGEETLLGQLLDKYPSGILSLVIDSYSYTNFCELAGTKFKEKILARDGKVVFRPDSGDPVSVMGDVLDSLEKNFGATKNKKGFKVLNPKVGTLWGDGIDYQGIRSILSTMRFNNWASCNLIAGMGGGLLQKLNRDTLRNAFKSSAQKRDGVWHDIFKKPLDSSKASKKGKLSLVREGDNWYTVSELPVGDPREQLVEVFRDGVLLRDYTFDEVRKNATI